MWANSDTPEESWSDVEGVDDDGEWPIKGIVGEELDADFVPTFEIRWDQWSRPDGTNTTWMKSLLDRPDLTRRWRFKQTRKRQSVASRSLNISLAPLTPENIIHKPTILQAQAYKEKLARRRIEGLSDYQDWDEVDNATPDSGSGVDFGSTSNVSSYKPSTSPTSSSSRVAADSSPSSTKSASSRPAYNLPVGAKKPQLEQPKKQIALQRLWSSAARGAGAASVYLYNDVDDQAVPPLHPDFRYLERNYVYDAEVPQFTNRGCFVTCNCRVCKRPEMCACQDPSELIDEEGRKECAYTKDGLFAFNVPPGVDVIECNRYCACSISCLNRVSQRPRDIPIEVFKTIEKGWGVRARSPVKQGKVIGLYTGTIIPRSTAEMLPEAERLYVFDLDTKEGDNLNESSDSKYSVNGYTLGNWTRFLNHSCEPNLSTYSVVSDTIPETGISYLAFVATMDIPTRVEFTVDYNPAATRRKKKGKKVKIPSDAKICTCGAETCRGWL